MGEIHNMKTFAAGRWFGSFGLLCTGALSLLAAPPPGYHLAWSDEFDSASLDINKWSYRQLGKRRDALNVAEAVSVRGGQLTITTYTAGGQHCTGMIGTQGKFERRFGYWEARLKFDDAPGQWSAFWIQSPTFEQPPGKPARAGMEIDVVEHRAVDRSGKRLAGQAQHTVHWVDAGKQPRSQAHLTEDIGLDSGFHTYGCEWTESEYRFFIDDRLTWTAPAPVSKRNQYMILSSEVEDGAWAGKVPASGYGSRQTSQTRLVVDYVRFYEREQGPAGAALPPVEFRSGQVSVQFDGQFHQRLRWLGDRGHNILAFDPAVQDSVEINGQDCAEFVLDRQTISQRRTEDPEFGPGLEGILAGVYRDEQNRIALEKRVRVFLPDRFGDSAVFEKTYHNLGGQPAHLGRVFSQHVLLNRAAAEPGQPSHAFASFQGGAYHWGKDYSLIWLKPGFHQLNFLGLDNRLGPEGEGGGMPFIDLWAPAMGLALVHLERIPQWINLPVEVRADGKVEMGIWEKPLGKFKQQEWLAPDESFHPVVTAVIFHHGDYYDALHTYGRLLRARGIAIPTNSPPSAYVPYWKSWGFGFDCGPEKIFAVLPGLKAMGITMANLDDGWFDFYGDWQGNPAPGKFPGGAADMRAFVKRMHAEGFKTSPWWYPLGVSTNSLLAKEHPELLVQDEQGNYPIDDRKVRLLCPAFEPARHHIASVLKRFIQDWGFDGVYVDGIGLTAVPPCFNPAHRHRSPLDSFQALPRVFKLIHDDLYLMKADPYLEVCICAMPHSPYNMPYYPLANASDPVNAAQVRQRVKLEKAIRGPTFCVGDCYQVPLDQWKGFSVPESFETAMGTGAQLTTFYAQLSEPQRAKWTRWFRLANELRLSSGEYLNLYDIAFDEPEIHVVRKGKDLFYGIFADVWPPDRPIELRGLEAHARYELFDYARDRSLGVISGADPHVKAAFKESLLLRVRPQ